MNNSTSPRDVAGQRIGAEPLFTPAEVAALFRVDPKTVTRWAEKGKLPSFRTLGGHRRFRQADVYRLLGLPPADAPDAVPVPVSPPPQPTYQPPAVVGVARRGPYLR